MKESSFTAGDLYRGTRFLAPLSENALLEAAAAAGARPGETVLDLGCGNGAAAEVLAVEGHLYVRGVEADPDLFASAVRHRERSVARARLRFYEGAPDAVTEAAGPVDIVCSLFGTPTAAAPGHAGRVLVGRYVLDRPGLADVFFPDPHPGAEPSWRRTATPLEWERFLAPQERALRELRRGGEAFNEIARRAESLCAAVRAHGPAISYELCVYP